MKSLFIALVLVLTYCTSFSPDKTVLICMGKSSYAYHARVCQGLKKCSVDPRKVTLEEAKKMKRKACGYCYK